MLSMHAKLRALRLCLAVKNKWPNLCYAKCKSSLYTHETHCVTYELCLCNFRLTLVGAGPTGIEEINVHAFLMELTGKVYRSNCDH